jgi:hypothetical protein
MKTYYTHPLKIKNYNRIASLVGIMLWSAHYHTGQWSREYRMGCRARQLLNRHNEIGSFLASRWFDQFESYVTGESERPSVCTQDFSETVKATYQKLSMHNLVFVM